MVERRALIVAPLYGPGFPHPKSAEPLRVSGLPGGSTLKERLVTCLQVRGSYEVDAELAGGLVSAAQFRPALRRFLDSDGELLFYFYGHGCLNDLREGVFVTSDAVVGNEGVPMSGVIGAANRSRAREVVLILDCCHAGAAAPATEDAVPKQLRPGRMLLAGCAQHQQGWETEVDEQKVLGAYSAHILDGLEDAAMDEAGRVTGDGLARYVANRFGSWDQKPLFVPPSDGIAADSFVITTFEPEPARGRRPAGMGVLDPERLREHLEGLQGAFVAHMCRGQEVGEAAAKQAADRYVELLARERPKQEREGQSSEGQPVAAQAEKPPAPVGEWLREPGVRLLVIGDGGGGKTTTLLRMAYDEAARALPDPAAPVPVYLKLNPYEGKGLDELLERAGAPLGLKTEEMKALWLRGERGLLFLLDGYNEVRQGLRDGSEEVAKARRTSIESALQSLLQAGGHRYAVTSRPGFGLEGLADTVSGARVVNLVRLSPEQAQGLLAVYGAAGIYEQMGERLRELAGNPFMLWALAQSCRGLAEPELPRNVGQLYQGFIDRYIFEEREPRWNRQLTRYNYELVKKPVLARLALGMARQGATQVPESREILVAIRDQLREIQSENEGLEALEPYAFMPQPPAARELLDEVVHNGMLQRVGGTLEFMHESVRDYFAAVAMQGLGNEGILGLVRPMVWRHVEVDSHKKLEVQDPLAEALTMQVGLLPPPKDPGRLAAVAMRDELLETLATHHPLLAARCLAAARDVGLQSRKRLNEAWLALLNRRHERYRRVAYQCLETAGVDREEVALQLVQRALQEDDYGVQMAAGRALATIERPSREICILLFEAWQADERKRESYSNQAGDLLASLHRPTVEQVLQQHLARNWDRRLEENAGIVLEMLPYWESDFLRDDSAAIRLWEAERAAVQRKEHADRLEEQARIARELEGKQASQVLELLENEDPDVRLAAVTRLGELKASGAVKNSLQVLQSESDWKVRLAIVRMLVQLEARDAVPCLMELLSREVSADVRGAIVAALGTLGDRREMLGFFSDTLQAAEGWHVLSLGMEHKSSLLRDGAIPAALQDELEFRGIDPAAVSVHLAEDGLAQIHRRVGPTWLEPIGLYVIAREDRLEVYDSESSTRVAELGGILGEEAVTVLGKALQEGNETLRAAAAVSLGTVGGGRAVMSLARSLEHEQSDKVLEGILTALGETGSERAIAPVVDALTQSDRLRFSLSQQAHAALEVLDREAVFAELGKALRSGNLRVRLRATKELGRWQEADPRLLAMLRQALQDPAAVVREGAVQGLAKWRDRETEQLLLDICLSDPDRQVRQAAGEGLRWFDGDEGVDYLLSVLHDPAMEATRRVTAARALGFIEAEKAVEGLVVALEDGDGRVRASAAVALIRMRADVAVDPMRILWGEAIERIGEDEHFLPEDANLYWWRGQAYQTLGRLEDALADYDRADVLAPGNADILRQCAEVLDRLGRHQEALAAAQRALELLPEHAWYLQDVGHYALKAGEYPTAVAVLREAERPEGLVSLHTLMLGLALRASGDPAGAEASYQQAVEICRGADPILANADLSVAEVKLAEVASVRPDLEEEIEEARGVLEAAREELRGEDEEAAWPKEGADVKLTPEEAWHILEELQKRMQAILGED